MRLVRVDLGVVGWEEVVSRRAASQPSLSQQPSATAASYENTNGLKTKASSGLTRADPLKTRSASPSRQPRMHPRSQATPLPGSTCSWLRSGRPRLRLGWRAPMRKARERGIQTAARVCPSASDRPRKNGMLPPCNAVQHPPHPLTHPLLLTGRTHQEAEVASSEQRAAKQGVSQAKPRTHPWPRPAS